MAFTLEVIRGSTTYNISDGNPFSFERAEGMGAASVRNIEESGPYQDGATHLEYRLDPRTITLSLNVIGASATALDGHRDTLAQIFKPVTGVPIILKVTRDDGAIRQLDCQRTGPADIPLIPINRPGNLHRSVVQLRAADPLWYDPSEDEQEVAIGIDPWYTGGGSVSLDNVLTYATNPTVGQAMIGVGTVGASQPFTFYFRSDFVPVGTAVLAYQVSVIPSGTYFFATLTTNYRVYNQGSNPGEILGTALMAAGVQDYFIVSDGGTVTLYRGTVNIADDAMTGHPGFSVANGIWRDTIAGGGDWPEELPYAAVYDTNLTTAQMAAIIAEADSGGAPESGGTVAYEGDFPTFPVIEMSGPMNDPDISNTTTGEILSFAGGTIAEGETWTIDMRYGRKSATDNVGSSVLNYLSESSDLATFHIEAAPLASGGTNVIGFSATGLGTASACVVSYYNRYTSF